jgi:nicotinamide-nucleotide amidase
MVRVSTPERPATWAEIVAVGTELLVPPKLDTNSGYATERLNEIGIQIRAKTVVGDVRADLESVLRGALSRSDIIVVTGGLGPTDDDLTRDAVAEVLGVALDEDARIVDRIRRRFAARGLEMPEVNRRQALVPRGAEVLENPNGTAPGLWMRHGARVIVVLPGPPREMRALVDRVVGERLAPFAGGVRLFRRVLRTAGRTESHVEQIAQPIYSRWTVEAPPITTTVLASPSQIELHLMVACATEDEGRARLDAAVDELAAALGADLVSSDGASLEEVVGRQLRSRGWRIGVAESCTGGLISSRLTDVAGSSDYVTFNAVCYSNEAKTRVLGVAEALIAEHGAVSEQVALAMARGARDAAGAEVGVGVTGIAGPSGGTTAKPVGTVAIAVLAGDRSRVGTFLFPGSRPLVKSFAAQTALDIVRRMLTAVDGAADLGTGDFQQARPR